MCETEDRREAVVRAGAKRIQESDKRPAAAARQRGAERMKRMARVLVPLKGYPKISQVMQV